MANTLTVDIIDMAVPPLCPVRIAIVGKPNPVTAEPVTGEQLLQLIQFPKYKITETATGKVVNGGNIYDYFPELQPGGGGGGGSDISYTIASYIDGTTGETTYRLMESRDGGTPVAVGDVIEFRGDMMLVTYGTQQMLLNTALTTINDDIEDKQDKAPDGTHNLIDADGVVDPRYLPDYLLGACIYAGNVGTGAVATLTTAAQHKLGTTAQSITLTNDTTDITGYTANEGIYYIATAEFSFASLAIKAGDWLISTGTMWSKVDNTDAVTGVKGDAESTYRIGNVNITKSNIGLENVDNTTDLDKPISTATQEALDLKLNTADVDDALSEESENPVQNKVITTTIGDVDEVLQNVLSRAGGHVVKITTLAGATVTITNQSNTYTVVADSNGLAEFMRVEAGTYTVYASIDDAVSDSISIVIADHTATEDSFATLTVSASDNTTITATDGTVTKTLEYTGTPIVQYVSLGTWDLSCVIDEETVTEQVVVSAYENTNVHLEPSHSNS